VISKIIKADFTRCNSKIRILRATTMLRMILLE